MSAPWFVGGGAEHSPETARLIAHAATSGAVGIVSPGDYKVRPLDVPGGGVIIGPGAGVLPNKYDASGSQSYLTRRGTDTTQAITPTTSSGGRTDLIIQRISDPQYSGSLSPLDPNAIFDPFTVIQNVPAGIRRASELNLSYPAMEIATVTLPASTGTVQASHITDLRRLANPRRERHLFRHTPSADVTLPRSNDFGLWPLYEPTFDCPPWATHVVATMTAYGVWKAGAASGTGHAIGDLTLEYCTPGVGSPIYAIGTTIFEEESETANRRFSLGIAGEKYIEPQFRGLTRSIRIGARLNPTFSGTNAVVKAIADSTNFVIDVEFQERAV